MVPSKNQNKQDITTITTTTKQQQTLTHTHKRVILYGNKLYKNDVLTRLSFLHPYKLFAPYNKSKQRKGSMQSTTGLKILQQVDISAKQLYRYS